MAANQEVLDAINATIATNGVKGISAESLRNILTLMVENSGNGGGSGDGLLRVMMPILLMDDIEMDFTQEYYDEFKGFISSVLPSMETHFDLVVEEMFRHNASVYTQLIEKASKLEGVMCLLDVSAFNKALCDFTKEIDGSSMRLDILSMSIPCSVEVSNYEQGDSATDHSLFNGILIKPLFDFSGEGIYVEMKADGSIRTFIGEQCDYIYVSDEGVALTDEQKRVNISAIQYSNYMYKRRVRRIVRANTDEQTEESINISILYSTYDSYTYFENGVLKTATIADDGLVTVTTIGAFNIPTE